MTIVSRIDILRTGLDDECLAVVVSKLKALDLTLADVLDYADLHNIACTNEDSIHTLSNRVVMHVFNNQG